MKQTKEQLRIENKDAAEEQSRIDAIFSDIRENQKVKSIQSSNKRITGLERVKASDERLGIEGKKSDLREPRRLSKYRGVCYHALTGQWRSEIKIRGERIVRYCDTEEAAARTYDRLAVKHRGEAAVTNFPIDGYEMPVVEKLEYEDRECRGRTDWYRNVINKWVSVKSGAYRRKTANWVIVSDLFFAGEVPDDIMEICDEMGVKGSEFYL